MVVQSPDYDPNWNRNILRINESIGIADTNGEFVNVAVIDTGVDYNLDTIKGRFDTKVKGYDFVAATPNVTANNESIHGTLVAQIIADQIVGIAPGVRLYSLKVMDTPTIRNKRVVQALYWCQRNNIDIVNMSFGGQLYDKDLHITCTNLHTNGITLVAAGGNNETGAHFPASFNDAVISVAAIDPYIIHCNFSNVWSSVDISAPGVGFHPIYEPEVQPGTEIRGTSYSTPQITGIISIGISMLKKQGKKATPSELEQALKETAYAPDYDELTEKIIGQWRNIYDPNRIIFDESDKGKEKLSQCMYGTGIAQADKFVMQLKKMKGIQ